VGGAVENMFDRYDVDASGTLNTVSEVRMLAINVVFTLQLPLTNETITQEVDKLGEIDDSNALDSDAFTLWFAECFQDRCA